MASFLPVGLTHLLPATGESLVLTSQDVTSDSGKIGPLLLKMTNASDTDTAVMTYINNFVPTPPAPPVTYSNIIVSGNGGPGQSALVNITIVAGVSATVEVLESSPNWRQEWEFIYPGDAFTVDGAFIGGQSVTNNLTFVCTLTNPAAAQPGDAGSMVQAVYQSGTIPGSNPTPSPEVPTYGNPTKVVTISPLTTEFVQIPSSGDGSTTLFGSGADVYVTPVQIVA